MRTTETTFTEREVRIPAGPATLEGSLTMPAGARAVVLFAHGSGSSRWSARNLRVAAALQSSGLATLLFDLLTREEEEADRYTSQYRFDIPLLAERLVHATRWIDADGALGHPALGYFGASTGSPAALVAASMLSDRVAAIVSRGGRPDLADDALERVTAPTLLIVGGADHGVIELNEAAYERLRCEKALALVPHATHLFEEPGALDEVARLAGDWFTRHLRTA